MPFLTKGKTNWRYILIVLIVGAIICLGILSYSEYLKREIVSIIQFSGITPSKKVAEEMICININEMPDFKIQEEKLYFPKGGNEYRIGNGKIKIAKETNGDLPIIEIYNNDNKIMDIKEFYFKTDIDSDWQPTMWCFTYNK